MIVLGLDVGTTATKGVAYNSDGTPVASARVEYGVVRSGPNNLELDPETVCQAIKRVIGEIATKVGRGEIRAIASAALGEAIVPLGKDGCFLYNSITALDTRARFHMRKFCECVGPFRFFQITGQMPHPITSLAKLLWFREKEPDIFQSARSFFCWNEILCVILGIPPAISPSLAARTGMYDLREGTWSDEILSVAGIDSNRLARIVPSGSPIGVVASDAAAEFGLSPRCVLVSGGWDQACVALGSGVISAGIVVNSLGSTDSLNASFREVLTTDRMFESGLTCTPHVLDGLFCTVAYSLTGGNLLQWYRDTVDPDGAAQASQRQASYFDYMVKEAMISKHPIWVLPHFVGSGTPYMDTLSRGTLLNLSLSTAKRDIARGILEGIALEMGLNLENIRLANIPVKEIRAGSGGARNLLVLALRSAVYGLPIRPLLDTELGCRACALLALKSCGVKEPVENIVNDWVELGVPVDSYSVCREYYAKRLLVYKRIYPALRDFYASVDCLNQEAGPAPIL